MTRTIPVQLALFAFGLAILAGLNAGNSVTTTLCRALLAMVGAFFVGHLVALASKSALREHLSARKQQIDKEHVEQSRAAGVTEAAEPRREAGVA